MRVLVTNDDGVEAPGLAALAAALDAAGHDVFVVAPSGERSGSGAAIGRLHRSGPIVWAEGQWSELPGVPIHSVDVPPAAAVYAGCLGAFGPPPDAVASGVNPGLNYGHLVLHSGTVGAALTAAALGVPAVAVSLGWGDAENFATAATIAAASLPWLTSSSDAETARVLNLNVPNVALGEMRGVREASLAPFIEQWETSTRRGELMLEYVGHTADPAEGSDLALVRQGYAAATILTGIAAAPSAGAAEAIEEALSGYTTS